MNRLRVPFVIHWAGTPKPDLSGFIEPVRVPFQFVPRQLGAPPHPDNRSRLLFNIGTAHAQEIEPEEPNRELLEEFIDPLGPVRAAAYYSVRAQLRLLEPDNRQLSTLTTPNYLPSQADLDTMLAEIATARTRVAARIAHGRGFGAHAAEFGVTTAEDYQGIVENVLSNPATRVRSLARGRTAFYYEPTNTIVIVNPDASDSGTAFRPTAGIRYFQETP